MEILAIILVLLIVIAISLFAGILIGINRMRKAIEDGSVGHLRIDRSEEDEPPKPFLEIVDSTIEAISHKDFVILKVINKNYISRD
jgi:hypothetical protein